MPYNIIDVAQIRGNDVKYRVQDIRKIENVFMMEVFHYDEN